MSRIEEGTQVLAASLSENLGYGLLVICDSRADFHDLPEILPGLADQPLFISSKDATVVKVQHGSDGDVAERWRLRRKDYAAWNWAGTGLLSMAWCP